MADSARRRTTATNVTLDSTLVAEAKALGVSISRASNRGLEEAVKAARAERWSQEHREALKSSNAWVEASGLPLGKHRLF